MANELVIIDKDGNWFSNTGAFRAVDPTNGHFFEPQVKYKIRPTEWMTSQPTIIEVGIDDDVTEKAVVPKRPVKPSLPLVDPVTSEPLEK